VDVDHGQLVYPSLEDVAIVMDLHELAPVGGRATSGRHWWRLERFAKMRKDFPDQPGLVGECDEPDVAAICWARQSLPCYASFLRAFSSLAASPEYRERFLGEEPGLLAPKHARCFLGSLLRSVLRAARKALYSRSVVVGSYVMGSASLPVEASILALGVALSGMNSGGLHELMASPEKLVLELA
jgi:hypothetical protein